MPAPRILPLGFIDRTTDNGAIIRLTAPSDSHNLRPETPATLRRRSAGNGTSGHAGGGGHDDWNQPRRSEEPWRRCPRSWNGASAPGWPEGSGTRGCPWWRSPRSWRSPGPASIGTCLRQKATNPDTGATPPPPARPGGCTGWGVTSGLLFWPEGPVSYVDGGVLVPALDQAAVAALEGAVFLRSFLGGRNLNRSWRCVWCPPRPAGYRLHSALERLMALLRFSSFARSICLELMVSPVEKVSLCFTPMSMPMVGSAACLLSLPSSNSGTS